MSSFIIPYLCGRLGNNLFQIASAYSLSIDFNLQFYIDIKQKNILINYIDSLFQNIVFQNIDDTNDIFNKISLGYDYIALSLDSNKNHRLYGYAQNFRFFHHNYNKIISYLNIDHLKFSEYYDINFNNYTMINIRRGDYLSYPDHHPVLSIDYIYNSINLLNLSINDNFLVTSDDIEWCKLNIKLPNIQFLNYKNPINTFLAISRCKNIIISNSTFSWWAAYVAKFVENVVVPQDWFGPAYSGISPKGYHCPGWIVAPTTIKNGLIYPN